MRRGEVGGEPLHGELERGVQECRSHSLARLAHGGVGKADDLERRQAAPQIDALWNHDDDQGVGVLAAIEGAGRDEFFMVGGAGSANAMREIESGDSVLEATVIYPHTQAADGIKLARLIVQGKNMSDLTSQGIPRRIVLDGMPVRSAWRSNS